jgi:probable F420-dependent oxidoreductase
MTPLYGLALGGALSRGVPDARDLIEQAQYAETLGYHSVWAPDHVMMRGPVTECVTLLGAFAGATRRIQLGSGVYLLPLRHPVVTAKMFAMLDYISGGRLIFGIGVGGEFAREFESCGVPVTERGARADEALEIIERLWTEPVVTHRGRFYQFSDAAIEPRPTRRPPVWIGGRSEAAERRVARFGNGWLAYLVSPRRIAEARERILERMARQRPGERVQIGVQLFGYIAPSREAGRRMVVEDLDRWYRQSFDAVVDRYCAFGTPAECAETVRSFADAGVDLVVIKLTCAPAEQRDQQAAFAEAVIPLVGDSGRTEPPPRPTSFTGDRRIG